MTNNTVPAVEPVEPEDLAEVLRGLLSRIDAAKRRLLDAVLDGSATIGEQQRLVAKASGVALAHDYVRSELTRIEAGAR